MPPPPAPAVLPWADVVARLRLVAEGDPDRLSVIVGLPRWRQFLSAWSTAASFLVRCGEGESLPESVYRANTFDQNLAWAWEVVDAFVDPLLHTVDTRSSLSSAEVWQTFEIMRGGALVLPDGSCLSTLRDLSAQHARAESSALIAASAMAAWKVSRARAASAPQPKEK